MAKRTNRVAWGLEVAWFILRQVITGIATFFLSLSLVLLLFVIVALCLYATGIVRLAD